MRSAASPRLAAALAEIVGTPCIAASAGYGYGSRITLHFGKAIPPRDDEIPRRRTIKGEFGFYLACAWRVTQGERLLTTSWSEDRDERGFCLSKIGACETVVGRTVVRAGLVSQWLDFEIELEGNVLVSAFCDQSYDEEGFNYTFQTRDAFFLVDADLRLYEEIELEL